MNTAQAWIEKVTYVDCPLCDKTIELGTDVSFKPRTMMQCDGCRLEFEMMPPEDA